MDSGYENVAEQDGRGVYSGDIVTRYGGCISTFAGAGITRKSSTASREYDDDCSMIFLDGSLSDDYKKS